MMGSLDKKITDDKTARGFARISRMKNNLESGRVVFYIQNGRVVAVEMVEKL